MRRVRPGVELVRASLAPTRVLIPLDLPTFERPRNATAGKVGAGKCAASVAAAMNRERTLMLQCAMGRGELASLRTGPKPYETACSTLAPGAGRTILHSSRIFFPGGAIAACSLAGLPAVRAR